MEKQSEAPPPTSFAASEIARTLSSSPNRDKQAEVSTLGTEAGANLQGQQPQPPAAAPVAKGAKDVHQTNFAPAEDAQEESTPAC
eukprot:4296074-Pleurochrysis_carterae.AAC.1